MDSPQVLRKGTTLTTEDHEGVRTPRRVLVTGANRGLGLEIVKALLERDDVDKVYFMKTICRVEQYCLYLFTNI